jgi:uncharacterized SAM-binding protein YcdF (DUF218 family)
MSSFPAHPLSLPAGASDAGGRAAAGGTGGSRLHRVLRRGRQVALVAGLSGLLGLGYLGGGFLRFTQEVAELGTPQRVEAADGIVVLTGGALRVDQAIDLLKNGRAKRLLISGVNPGTSIATLSRLTATDRAWFDCCVDLDYEALNTIGNAEMADLWARNLGFKELILVTSDYHMPRTLLEFDRFAHVSVIRPYPVARSDLWSTPSLPTSFGLKVLLTEYAKFLATRLRLAVGAETAPALVSARAAAKRAS